MNTSCRYVIGFVLITGLNSCNSQTKENQSEKDSSSITAINDSTAEVVILYSNGKLKELSQYNRENELNGIYEEYYENGIKKISWFYSKNRLHGIQKSWDEDGRLTNISNYFRGEKDGKQINFRKGDTLSIEYFEKGKLLHKRVADNYYTPPETMLKSLLSQGLDSLTAITMLRENKSGYIVKDGNKALFIEDSSISGLIGNIMEQANAIEKTKYNTPITYEYLKSKGLKEEQIKYLIKNGYIKLANKNLEKL